MIADENLEKTFEIAPESEVKMKWHGEPSFEASEDNVSFKCSVEVKEGPTPSVTWFKGDVEITSGGKVNVSWL